jgi:hypothetical protein
MDIRDQIKAEIADQEANLQKLKIALEVVESFIGWKPAAKALAAPKAEQPLFTVKRVGQPASTQKARRTPKSPGEFYAFTRRVVATLAANGKPMRSGDVIEALEGKGNKSISDDVYRALSQLKSKGEVSRSDDGLYNLIKQSEGEAEAIEQPSSETGSAPPRAANSAEAA